MGQYTIVLMVNSRNEGACWFDNATLVTVCLRLLIAQRSKILMSLACDICQKGASFQRISACKQTPLKMCHREVEKC
jgi:hypothetical protein